MNLDTEFIRRFEKYTKKGITQNRASQLLVLTNEIIIKNNLFNTNNEYIYAIIDKLTDIRTVYSDISAFTYMAAIKEWNDYILMKYNIDNEDYTFFLIDIHKTNY